MAKNKLVKEKTYISFEKDEKKSIIIALVVSAVLVLSTVLAFIAIKKNGGIISTEISEEVVDSYVTSDAMTEDGSFIVKNQEELDLKLTESSEPNSEVGSITIQTDEEQSLEIPEGDYRNVALNVDAPYTEVFNHANFNTINISQISANTWTEYANGNNIVLTASASHVIVDASASVSSIANIGYGSTLAIEIYGSVDDLSLEAEDSISSVSVSGRLGALNVYSKTNLALSGSSTDAIPFVIQSSAEGSVVKTSVPVSMSTGATLELYLQEGAEASEISVTNKDVVTNIYNNTADEIHVIGPEEKDVSIPVGDVGSLGEAKAPEESSSDGSSGAATSSSSSSTSSSSSSSSTSSSSGGESSRKSSSSSSSSSTDTTTQQTVVSNAAATPVPTATPTPTPTPTPTKKATATPTPTKKTTPTPTPSTIASLNSKITDLEKKLKGVTDTNTALEKKVEEMEKQQANIDAAQAIIDSPVPYTIYKDMAALKGETDRTRGIGFRYDNEAVRNYFKIVRFPTVKGCINEEYICLDYSSDAAYEVDDDDDDDDKHKKYKGGQQYLAQLVYYYFIDDETTTEKQWTEMHSTEAVPLSPGDTYCFARPRTFNTYEYYYIEIVLTESEVVKVEDDRTESAYNVFNMDTGILETSSHTALRTVQVLFTVEENGVKKAVGLSTVTISGDHIKETNDMGLTCAAELDGTDIKFYSPPREGATQIFNY